jgi:pimeloyl-ACP methyl ester carboxylesterase
MINKIIFFLFLVFIINCGGVEPGEKSPSSVPWISADEWKLSGSYVLSKYGKIFSVEKGEGDVILFLHGFPTSSYDYYPITEILKKNNKLLLLDFLGYGYSDKPKEINYSYKIQVDIIEDLLKQKKVDNLIVVAHDYGVTAAQEMMSRALDRKKNNSETYNLKGVIFLNGGIFPESHKPRIIQSILASSFGKYLAPYISKGMFQKNFLEVFGEKTRPSQFELDEMWKIMNYQSGQKLSHKLLHYIQERKDNREKFVSPLLSGSIPFLLVNGSDDPVSGEHVVKRYVELTRKDNYVSLPDIGHYPQIETDAKVSEIISNFYKQNK